MKIFLRNFFRKETVLRALKVAVVVAPILIVINHHDNLLSLDITPALLYKSALTFFVPYCVSAYSSAMAYTSEELG